MRRIAFYLFYDENGEVDDYIPVKLSALQEFVKDIIVISNSKMTAAGRAKLEGIGAKVICRENVGFDVWGYKEGIESVGYDRLAKDYDEAILLNYTFFAPIFPFSELFDEMSERECDFWGISEHDEMVPNPFTGVGVLPRHIQSHFIAVRKKMLGSLEFKKYWQDMPMIKSYTDSVLRHESRFTNHFESMGFVSSVYINNDDYPSAYPTFIDVKQTIENRSPILKRRLFFHDPMWLDINCVDLRGTIETIEKTSDYDLALINQNINRTVKPRVLYTNLEQLRIVPDNYLSPEYTDIISNEPKIAVIAHVFYSDMWEEIYDYIKNIPYKYDLYISTSSDEDADILKEKTESIGSPVDIRVVEENRGRDMSSLFITFKDIGVSDKYDYVCRVHSKKSPQNGFSRADSFKKHLYQNLLGSPEYISNLIGLMNKNSDIGLVFPPLVHIGYPTMGHAWFANYAPTAALCKKLGIEVPLDDDTPVAAFGTMFWFRPAALRPLFEHNWKWTEFNAEPAHVDGGLSHVLERIISYVSKNEGFSVYSVMTPKQAEKNYTKLEFKHQKIMSTLPNGDVNWQYTSLRDLFIDAKTGRPEFNAVLSGCTKLLFSSFRRTLWEKYPRVSKLMYGPYRLTKKIYKLAKFKKKN
ncbi:lipopolysaccharide biosynthesis protein [Enterobacter sp. Ap-1006]|uniref:rhamnan synthesis F family protein n=1 Tax=Enterobacter sp. Ap-1006 TaxID=2608345 RepID=UPI00141FED7F|nr:rhamnan synthesis F family protein [Enterobacter sp. Ap-1006]NIF46734.1 lipopolysaccharide biosynthesis protein [Enterobacter sp. Ap-1006]